MKILRKLILNYPVFDGIRVNDAATVVIENGKISRETVLEQGEASSNFFLMPGLIDGHTHLIGKVPMDQLVRYGVTTTCAVDVSASVASQSDSLKIWTSRTIALGNISGGNAYVEREIGAGADYIKVILESPDRMAPKTMDATVLCDIVRRALARREGCTLCSQGLARKCFASGAGAAGASGSDANRGPAGGNLPGGRSFRFAPGRQNRPGSPRRSGTGGRPPRQRYFRYHKHSPNLGGRNAHSLRNNRRRYLWNL